MYPCDAPTWYVFGQGAIEKLRIPDDRKECVVFLGHEKQGKFEPKCTAFLVGYDSIPYLVTAKHNAISLGTTFTARFNVKGEGYANLSIAENRWFFHPTDEFVDVAVTHWPHRLEMEYKYIAGKDLASHAFIEQQKIGMGDDVVIIGLYYRVQVKGRITPIARCGTIAMMPTDKIAITVLKDTEAKISGEANAYLIEAKSVSGFSGSPVFVRHYFPDSTGTKWNQWYSLLGLVHGHWDIKDIPPPFLKDINEGIVHVVPSQKIIETLDHPELNELRKQTKIARADKAVMD